MADAFRLGALAQVTEGAMKLAAASQYNGGWFNDIGQLLEELAESKMLARKYGATDEEIHKAVEEGL